MSLILTRLSEASAYVSELSLFMFDSQERGKSFDMHITRVIEGNAIFQK